jgi:hypothetical protein
LRKKLWPSNFEQANRSAECGSTQGGNQRCFH